MINIQCSFRKSILLLFSFFSLLTFHQKTEAQISKPYVQWGYNRSYYTTSDIQVIGEKGDFDFTLENVKAHDDHEKFVAKVYLNPTKFTIPQFNFRVGFFWKDKWIISGGWDHLKYKVKFDQDVLIFGYINESATKRYAGEYNGELVNLNHSFFLMEHTDGLNFVQLNVGRSLKPIWLWNDKLKIDPLVTLGTGPVTPWTDTKLFDVPYRNPTIHFAGWGFNLAVSPRVTFFDRVFVQADFRGGWIKLWDIRIEEGIGKAKQQIDYFERNVTLGILFGKADYRKTRSVEVKE